MSLSTAYIAYMGATTIYAIVVAQMARRRAILTGAPYYAVYFIMAWYDFWIGSYYDRKQHRVFMFPIPMIGICVDFDANPLEE